MRIKAHRAEQAGKREALEVLWMLAPPTLWALQQQISYALTPSACAARAEWWLHAVTVLALLAVAGITFLAWADYRRLSAPSRSRFLAASGIGSGMFFLIVILATELPNWFLGACLR